AAAWRGARRAAAARPPVSRAGRAHARVLVRTTALPRRGDQGGAARDSAARAGGAPACAPVPTRRATSHARRLYEAHHRRFTHVHRLSAPVPGAGAGSPPHRTGPHGRRPGRGSARLPLGLEAPGQASALPRGVGAVRQVRRHAPEPPDGPGWRRPRCVLGWAVARHRAHDPVHGAAGQTGGGGAVWGGMNGPAGATVAGGGVTASSGARRSVARSRRSPVAPPFTPSTT